ncbi:T9SS type A sorting domain-containing protein [Lentimicrobium sp. L6]|uniref:alpha-amylase family glycosyl hydrolase n=1 Tax=Lentimicrobium sp. L6 TaxID=2735916 RepID=UPI00155386C9|nr:alpha-amylase family glycosyl hydrolase [Lentimicrobium sp. L6]NPD85026.1 T9SS type A sorting domain-containing protein [Lentimicrobium sp. L6]
MKSIKKIILPLAMAAFFMAFCGSTALKAQIYAPEGLNMPGSWDDWNNPPQNLVLAGSSQTSGGLVQLLELETPIYQTIFSVSDNGGDILPGDHEFKFTSGPIDNIWQNQWSDVTVELNTIQEFVYNGVGENSSISLNNGKSYVMNYKNTGYENTSVIFMELSAMPVSILNVAQSPMLPNSSDVVSVFVDLSDAPSTEEKFYIQYSSNGWTSSDYIEMTPSGTQLLAEIPSFEDGVEVEYDIFSTISTNPNTNRDLMTIHFDNNSGNHYSYEVGEELSCGSSLSLIGTDPAFPMTETSLLITFNAELGNAGLAGYEGDIYVHTGVITNLSTSQSDWKYVKTAWGENTPETRLTRLDADLYELSISNARAYYEVPQGEDILELALVFRSDEPVGDNYLEGKTADNQDLFVTIYKDELNVKITYPSSNSPLVSPNTLVPVCVSAIQSQHIELFLGDSLMNTTADESIVFGLNTANLSSGSHWLIAKASTGKEEVLDSVMIFLRGNQVIEELPAGMKAGINYLDEQSVTLVLHDPSKAKDFAFVIGDFNNWNINEQAYMKRNVNGDYYWITIDGLTAGEEYAYQYYIDGELTLADAYCEKILDPWNDKYIPETTYPNLKAYPAGKTTGMVSVLETGQEAYDWNIENFTPVAINETQSNLIIYELLIRDFVGDQRIASVMDSLDYLKNLGVTAIELMPVQEFEGNDSWGYNPAFYFAPDKAYGTKNDYKAFIDACHQRGIAVILDVVYNHSFGQSPLVLMYWDGANNMPATNNAYYNQSPTHPYSPGYDFNHESYHTQDFVKRSLQFWMEEYKIDGFRFDLSKGFTQNYTGDDVASWNQYDGGRIYRLTDYYNFIKSVDPDTYVILEHLSDNDEQKELANSGMLLWGVMTSEFKQVSMGWESSSNYDWAYYSDRGFTYPNLIPFMESHDEERLMYENLTYGNEYGDYSVKDLSTALNRQQGMAMLYYMVPGPKMIWQFGELGYDYSINHCPDGSVSEDCRTSQKPIEWEYFNEIDRQEVYQSYAAMAKLKTSQEAFMYGEFGKDLNGMVKRAWLTHSTLNICAGFNMDVTTQNATPGFHHDGTWYNYFTGESIEVSGGYSMDLEAGEFYLFTDQNLGKPYVSLTMKVLREEDSTPIAQASVSLQGFGTTTTNAQGEAYFLPSSNQNYSYEVISGSQKASGNINIGESNKVETIYLINADALAELEETQILVYPNPTSENFIIENADGFQLQIYSLEGQLLLEKSNLNSMESINLKKWPAGIYLLYFKNDVSFFSQKLIKK